MSVRKRKEKTSQADNDEPIKQVSKLSNAQKKLISEYEENQRELLEYYESDKVLIATEKKEEEDEKYEDRVLAQSTLLLNIASLFANLIASISSGSLSVLSTFIDSSMDISCSFVMNMCLRLINKSDSFNYPRGRDRLELIGAILCATLMVFANLAMVVQSIYTIIEDADAPVLTPITLYILVGQTFFKVILCVMCYKRNTTSSLVIAMDLRNDIVTRTLALVSAYFGMEWKYADPIGAIIVCTIIAILWIQNALENIPILIGKTAERENLSRILKITIEHDKRIKYVDHIMVYHTGQQALVELHIVMDENLSLKITHDISHPLEKKLQRLPFVERAFVHCDYDCDGD